MLIHSSYKTGLDKYVESLETYLAYTVGTGGRDRQDHYQHLKSSAA